MTSPNNDVSASDRAQRQRLRVFVCVVILLSLAAGGTAGWFVKKQQTVSHADQAANTASNTAPRARSRPPALVRTSRATSGLLATLRPTPGRLQELRNATLASEVSGKIIAIPIEPGTHVIGGETLIAQIDTTWLDLTRQQTEAEIAALEAQLDHHDRELARFETLSRTAAVSGSELSLQKTTAEERRQSLVKAKLIYSEIAERLQRTKIVAPFDGFVVVRHADLGEFVSVGTPLAEIVSEGEIDAVVHVGEAFVAALQLNETIDLLIDSLRLKVQGRVHQIVPNAANAARMFPVFIRLDDRDGLLRVGLSVTAFIPTGEPRNGTIVPKDAVLEKPDGDTVWVVLTEMLATDNTNEPPVTVSRVKPVPVRIVATTPDTYQVVSETDDGALRLVPGAEVVIEGGERLVADQIVRVTTISPDILRDLPSGSGQTIIAPKRDPLTIPVSQ